MNISKITLLLASMLLILSSCKDDINITGSALPTAVVYSVLDPNDNVHFVKVTRAFVTSENQIETAAIADSNYFASVEGTIKEYYQGALKRTFDLTDTIVEGKKEGIFYHPEQKVYMFKTPKNDPLKSDVGYEYRLELDINNGEFTVSSATELVRNVKITMPNSSPISKFVFANAKTNTNRYRNPKVSGDYGNGSMYDMRLRVKFAEFSSANDSVIKSFDWIIRTGDMNSGSSKIINAEADGKTFYELMKNNVSNNSTIIKRNLLGIDVLLTSGSKELFDYINVSKPSSSIAQNKITYSNLTATNDRKAIGIFTARTTVVLSKVENLTLSGQQYAAIDKNSMWELCKGGFTGTLFFCSPSLEYKNDQDIYCH